MQYLSDEDIKKIQDATEKAKGTPDYIKYMMEMSERHDKGYGSFWTNWKFIGQFYFTPGNQKWEVRHWKERIYLVGEGHDNGIYRHYVERFEVSHEIKELLGW